MWTRWCLMLILGSEVLTGAEMEVRGWGHGVRGGAGGEVIMVTRLDDDVKRPVPGMLRWALGRKGAREIRLVVKGELWLKDRVVVREGRVTVDGRGAPGEGVTVRGGALEFEGCEEVILRHFRVRLGDENLLRRLKRERRKRPANSAGLDCVSLRDCRGVVLDHLSLGWSCDELLAVVRCQRVTVQWCLLAEPLGQARLHPYGESHAYGILASASTLTIHHCVICHYWMRGPQFEANDMRRGDRWEARMEAVSNVMADFGRSGARYTTGVEDHKNEARGRGFEFQFEGNVFLDTGGTGRSIEAVTKHGTHEGVRVWLGGNWIREARGEFAREAVLRTDGGKRMEDAPAKVRQQVRERRLFTSPNAPESDLGGAGLERLLAEAGAGPERDKEDRRVITELLQGKIRPVLRSQRDVD